MTDLARETSIPSETSPWPELVSEPTAPGALPMGLPMPRDLDILDDDYERLRVRRASGRRYPFPIPNGWFVVARSDELESNGVLARFYFGQSLVIFRTDAGEARVLDAYCAHLGAHLAVGGKVEGECIRCPFHGWAYDGASGKCTDIPYGESERIPPKAAVRSYPTIERNQMVFAWYHAEGKDPIYDVPTVDEFDDPEWLPMVCREFAIRVSCQDMAENSVDVAHFKFVHGSETIPEEEFVVDGTYKRNVGRGGMWVKEGFGLGLGVLRMKLAEMEHTFLSSTTPIDEENVLVRWLFTAPRRLGENAARETADRFCAGVSQDIPIWENKVFRDHPVLTRSEKPVLEFRQWARQFYSGYDDPA